MLDKILYEVDKSDVQVMVFWIVMLGAQYLSHP